MAAEKDESGHHGGGSRPQCLSLHASSAQHVCIECLLSVKTPPCTRGSVSEYLILGDPNPLFLSSSQEYV